MTTLRIPRDAHRQARAEALDALEGAQADIATLRASHANGRGLPHEAELWARVEQAIAYARVELARGVR